jgi:hypothetical protein
LRFVRLPESLKPSVCGSEPVWLVGPALIVVILIVWMKADDGVIIGGVIELVVVVECLTPGSA